MAIQLMKEEILKEMEAVKCFINLAILSQKLGHSQASQYFLSQAKEDCEHAFLYAKELDKHNALTESKSITEIVKVFQDMEKDAVKRVSLIKEKALSEKNYELLPFLIHILQDHSDEAYTAQKLLQKVAILDKQEALNDIEELFENLQEEE